MRGQQGEAGGKAGVTGSGERQAEKPVRGAARRGRRKSQREGQQDQKKILRIFSLRKEMSRESSVVSMDKIRLSPNVMPFLS